MRPTANELADELLRVFPALDADDQRLSLELYRQLAEGSPVALPRLAVGLPLDEVTRRLESWPGVYYDAERRVIGYWGLTLRPTSYRLRVGGRELFAWCAWDTLFLPALLGAKAEVQSVCRGSGQPVRLTIGSKDVESADPARLVVSFLVPDAGALRADVITSFCHYVHFFGSRVRFRVLERGPRSSLPASVAAGIVDDGYRDMFLVFPGETVRLALVPTEPGLSMVHCHNLEHEDAGMMRNFLVAA
jgi:alkylmercury lyase